MDRNEDVQNHRRSSVAVSLPQTCAVLGFLNGSHNERMVIHV